MVVVVVDDEEVELAANSTTRAPGEPLAGEGVKELGLAVDVAVATLAPGFRVSPVPV
jgi:hypothetical protein